MRATLQPEAKPSLRTPPAFTPVPSGLLQRKCARGNPAGSRGERQRNPESGRLRCVADHLSSSRRNPGVPLIVQDILERPGQSLDPATRAFVEPRFGHDFSRVRVHSDGRAAASARTVNALAYTVGENIVFGAGKYAPTTVIGRQLLAHELVHVVQQRSLVNSLAVQSEFGTNASGDPAEMEADRIANIVTMGNTAPKTPLVAAKSPLQRRSIFAEIGGLFSSDTAETDLKTYVETLNKKGDIEGFTDSDDKARAVANAWGKGKGGFNLTPKIKVLLIKEMQSGFTGDDDEQAILVLLEGSDTSDLSAMFNGGQLNAADLLSDFHGNEEEVLLKFLDERFVGGSKLALAGSTKLKPRAEKFGGAMVEITNSAEAKEVRQIIQEIKDSYGIDLNSEKGIEGIKKTYPNVPVTETKGLKTRAWKLYEIRALQKALKHYQPVFGAERAKSTRAKEGQEVLTVSKVEQSIDQDSPSGTLDTTTMGEYFADVKNFSLFKASEGKSGDFPGSASKQTEGTIVHEIAHGVLTYRLTSFISKFNYWKDVSTADADPVTKVANKKGVEAPITLYGAKNAREDVSETAMFFFVEPETLKKGRGESQGTPGNPCPRRHKFMEDTVADWKTKPPPPKKGKGKKP
jgi:hypothetical protein